MGKRFLSFLCALPCFFCAFLTVGWAQNTATASGGDSHTLFLAGDSTLDEHGGDESIYGSWGSNLRPFLREGCSIVNYGRSGRSTTSFIREGWWDAILRELSPGDFVVVQFGHNDQKLNDESIATPIPQYKENLRRMAADVRDKEASPIFATPIVRLTYGDDGFLTDAENLDAWAEAMREVANEEGIDLVDMRVLSRQAANTAGETEALTWHVYNDRTHPAPKGARLYAQLFLDNIRSRGLDVASLFVNAAESLSVGHGDTFIVSANANYGAVIVNGNLIIAPNVVFSCSTLQIANASGEVGTMTVGANASVSVTGKLTIGNDTFSCLVGVNGGNGSLTLEDGAKFTTSDNFGLGYISATTYGPAQGTLVLNGSATMTIPSSKTLFMQRGNTIDGTSAPLTAIILNGASVLTAGTLTKNNNTMAEIDFNGGTLAVGTLNANQYGKLTFKGIGESDIILSPTKDFDIGLIRNSLSGNRSAIEIISAGALVKRGIHNGQFCPASNNGPDNSAYVSLALTNGIVVADGGLAIDAYGARILNANMCDLTVNAGASLDLGGNDVMFDGVQAAGTITNSSSTTATLSVGGNGGDAVFGVAPSVPIVKQGAGILRIPDGHLGTVTVQGTLDLCNRAAVGFPYYRFWVKSPRNNIRLSEFSLRHGDEELSGKITSISEDITGGYHYESPANLVDGNFSTKWDNRSLGTSDWRTNNVYFVVHFGNAPNFTHDFPFDGQSHAPTSYKIKSAPAATAPYQPVSSYTFAFADKTEVAPLEWYFQGAMKGNEWRDLDHVTGFNRSGSPNDWCSTNFVANCGISTVSIESLAVADNATWSIDTSQAEINVGTLSAGRDITVIVFGVARPNGKVELPVSIGALSGSIGSWRMTFAEHPGIERGVCLEGGRLCATPEAAMITLR